MGLNLNIRRIIFAEIQKYKGKNVFENLTEFELRQIAGRAGRNEKDGFVNAFKEEDLYHIRRTLSRSSHSKNDQRSVKAVDLTPDSEYKFSKTERLIERACLFPPIQTICDFAEVLKKYDKKKHVTLSETLKK